MSKSKADRTKMKPATRLASAAREFAEHGMVNPAVYRASTVTFESTDHFHSREQKYFYGRRGTPTSRAIETAIAELEGGYDCKVCPSGLAAITVALLAFLSPGEHLLMVDTVYGPTRHFCDTVLKRMGIETEYYNPLIGARISTLLRPNTKVIFLEVIGSQTMEVQDAPAIAKVARDAGVVTMLDNTWSGGHYFKPFVHGMDISVQAATKYITGHSDCMFGSIVCNEATWPRLREFYETMGMFAGPDDMYLALRGLRTLDVRMERHMKSALKVAGWLRDRAEVQAVLYPALSNDPGHALWKRDFSGACGLFSVVMKPASETAVANMLNGLELFSMGYSWGGFESLVVPFKPERTATQWAATGPAIRFHIGLEDPDDLIADLEKGLARFGASS